MANETHSELETGRKLETYNADEGRRTETKDGKRKNEKQTDFSKRTHFSNLIHFPCSDYIDARR
jgi:hypothetical protein